MSDTKPCIRRILWCLCASLLVGTFSSHAAQLRSDPNNAALLYYQAFLLCPEPDDVTNKALDAVLRGAEPDGKIREYLKNCRESLELVEDAAQMAECDWGIRYSEGYRANLPLKQLDDLSRLLCADALVLGADGNSQAALGRYLTTRRLAAHIGDDVMALYAVAHQVDRHAQVSIKRVLGSQPLDVKVLTRLQDQIVAVRGAPQSPAKALRIDFVTALQALRTSPTALARIRDRLMEKATDESAKQQMRNLTDEELIARAREPYAAFLESALRVIDNEAPHGEKYEVIERLTRKLKDEFGSDPAAIEIISTCADQVLRLYRLQVTDTARFNALRVAMAIYIEKARTGQLPAKLGRGLPKDPYSAEDFLYERTEEGFVLRSQVQPFDEDRIRQYEFKVQE